jgi:hypothetical protein
MVNLGTQGERMRRSVYRELTTSLLADCRAAVSEFVASHHNRDVFAFVLDCDPFHGAVTVGINTKDGLAKVLRDKHPKAKRAEIDGLHGIRFRCQEFAFNDFGLSEESLQLLDEIAATQHDAKTDRTAERHADMLLLTLARVVLILETDLAALAQTDDFVSFVTEENASEQSRIALIRRTVSDEAFDRVFPEVRAFEMKLLAVSNLAPEERAKFWIDAARDLACENDTADTKRFREMGHTVEVMLDAITEFGSVAVSPLIGALEKTALEPQLNGSKTKAFRQWGANTPSAAFALSSIERIRAIRLVDEDNIARLHQLLRKLHRRDKGKKTGPIAADIALTLHEMRPHVFPEPKVDERSMSLLNPGDFGLK